MVKSNHRIGIFIVVFIVPMLIMAVFFPNGWRYDMELILMTISFLGLFGVLYEVSIIRDSNITSYYRPRPSQHFCPSCNFPYAFVRNEKCANCGASLRLERTTV